LNDVRRSGSPEVSPVMQSTSPQTPQTRPGFNYVKAAWAALAGTVVTLPLGILVGSVIIQAFGYDPNAQDTLPVGVMAVAGGLSVLVIVSAPVLSWWLGRKAVHHGDERGHLPSLIGLVCAACFVALNVVSGIAVVLFS
jgi:hypothetical protein